MTTISGVTSNLNVTSSNEQVKVHKISIEHKSANTISKDNLKQDITIQKGIIPTIKGVLVGGIVSSTGGIGVAALINSVPHLSAKLGTGALIGGIPGALAGGVVANYTNSKLKGALAGAGVGAITGAVASFCILKKFDPSMFFAMTVGATSGMIGGLSSSTVAKEK